MFKVIKPVVRQLADKILSVAARVSDTNRNVGTAMLIAFITLIMLVVVFFICPYMQQLRKEVLFLFLSWFTYVDVQDSLRPRLHPPRNPGR